MDDYTWPFARLIKGAPMTKPESECACECECHSDAAGEAGGFCSMPACDYWPQGQDPDPEQEEPELAAPPLEVTFRERR